MTTLSLVLRLNAASCIGFGALFAGRPVDVATAIGTVPPQVIFWLGVVLLLNGAHLVLASMRAEPCRIEVLWFSLGDFAWWLATMVLLGADLWITTGPGAVSASLVASLVAGIGAT